MGLDQILGIILPESAIPIVGDEWYQKNLAFIATVKAEKERFSEILESINSNETELDTSL